MRYRVVAISGALQENSEVTNIVRKCAMLKTSLDIQLVDIKHIPLLNIDLFTGKFPSSIEFVRDRVRNSDGLLFVVPQFFGKVSPAFKNIYDWLSYSPNAEHPSPIRGMCACLISVGEQEGGGAERHLSQMSQFCRLRLMGKPSLHFQREKLSRCCKNLEGSGGKEAQELQSFLEYFADFLDKRLKNK